MEETVFFPTLTLHLLIIIIIIHIYVRLCTLILGADVGDYYDDQPDAFGFSPDSSSRNVEENSVTSPKTSRYS